MDDELMRRMADNESLFRDVNEGIKRGRWPGEGDGLVGFRCECARIGCNTMVSMTPGEYEQVRAHPRRFMMVPGHELDDVETVVETRLGYIVVEKRDEAGRKAEATDPRG